MSYISYSTMPTLRRLVKIATKFRYVRSRNYGFVVFFFFRQWAKRRCASRKRLATSRYAASARWEKQKKSIYARGSGGARVITLQAWELALLTSLGAAAFLTSLTLLGRGVLWTVDARTPVTVVTPNLLAGRTSFRESTSIVFGDKSPLHG